MTSDRSAPREAFVWIWPPGATEPVVAGRLRAEGELFVFNYGRSWLARKDAVPIYAPELPLRAGAIPPEPPLVLANALRDASPDAWGAGSSSTASPGRAARRPISSTSTN